MEDFEKLGEFYLGRERNEAKSLLLYNSKHLTTHAMIVGMTGSGKTGLALAMLEEAALDGIPAILIDPKGDLANILLQFPDLAPEDFRPWLDASEAARSGVSIDDLAKKTATQWKEGLAAWGQDGERIRKLSQSADFAVYTPGDTSGRPLQILRAFNAPCGVDELTLRGSILNNVSSLLGLIGIAADPVQSREHILLSSIFYTSWKSGRDLSLEQLITSVATPPFSKIGVFDLESFYPSKERMKLAMALNALLASPGFAAWREGEPLDIAALLHTKEGKPRISVLTISHLSDAERMFFVTALLNESIAWMRRQSGAGSLRAIIYMDEIFGYFPPTANPPSKEPMLTLLKQARAFGLGIVLSTQNPVDLDYKGLSNCGTWFIGRLQTDRDKQRVLDGLEGVATDNGNAFERAAMDKMISGLGKRVFLMRDVNDDMPVLFDTRWVMSYMRGPLSAAQIRSLNKSDAKLAQPVEEPISPVVASPAFPPLSPEASCQADAIPIQTDDVEKTPSEVAATARLHFVDAKTKTDIWETRYFKTRLTSDSFPEWDWAEELETAAEENDSSTAEVISERRVKIWAKTLASKIYQECNMTFWRDVELKLISDEKESEGEFRVRAAQAHREKRDADIEKLQDAYNLKLRRLRDQVRKAEDKVDREKAQVKEKSLSTSVWIGSAILGAIFGRGRGVAGTIGRVGSTARSASKIGKEKQDVAAAEESAQILRDRLTELEAQFEMELQNAQRDVNPQAIELEEIVVRPRKSDIIIERLYFAK